MRVGLVIYDSINSTSGGYTYDRKLVSRLQERGDSVRIFSLPKPSYAGCLLQNLTVDFSDGLEILLQDELNHPSLFLANRRPRRPRIVSIVHHLRSAEHRPGWQNAIYRAVEREYLSTVDAFVFNSATTRSAVERLIHRSRPHVIATPGGDRLGTLTADDVRRRASEGGPLRLVFVGALTAAKGLDTLIDAMAILPRDGFEVRVIGPDAASPDFAARMRKRAANGGLPITFAGELAETELARELRAAQVLMLPSHYEGFGISILEGMAHGLVTIGTTAGAIPEVVTDGVTGHLIAPGDAKKLAEHVEALRANASVRLRMGLAALDRFRQFPTWEESTDRIRGFLLSLV